MTAFELLDFFVHTPYTRQHAQKPRYPWFVLDCPFWRQYLGRVFVIHFVGILFVYLVVAQLWCAHNTHITSTLLRQADVALSACRVHDVPQRQSDKATFMRGFIERFVGEYTGVWNEHMWNVCMPIDVEATMERDGVDKDGNVKVPYVVPESFKVRKTNESIAGSSAGPSGQRSAPMKSELNIVVLDRSLILRAHC